MIELKLWMGLGFYQQTGADPKLKSSHQKAHTLEPAVSLDSFKDVHYSVAHGDKC